MAMRPIELSGAFPTVTPLQGPTRMQAPPTLRQPVAIRRPQRSGAVTDAIEAGATRPLVGGGMVEALARGGEAFFQARNARNERDASETERLQGADRENSRRYALANAVGSYDPSQPAQAQNDALIRALSTDAPEEAFGFMQSGIQTGMEREGRRSDYLFEQDETDRRAPLRGQTDTNIAVDRARQLAPIQMQVARAGRAPTGAGQGPGYVRPSGRDAMMAQQYTTALQNGHEALTGLDNLEQLFSRLIERDAAGQPLPANMRRSLSRIAQTDPESRAILEQIDSQIWPLVLQNLQGLAPVTNVELSQAIQRTVNSDMTPEAIIGEVQRMRSAAQRGVDIGTRAYDFAGEAGSFTNGRDAQGRSWADVMGEAYTPGARQPAGGGSGGGGTPPPEAIQELRRDPSPEARAEFEEAFGLPAGGAQQYVPGQPAGARRTIMPPRR